MEKIVIGTIDGDGIGPIIMDSCRAVLEKLLADEIAVRQDRAEKDRGADAGEQDREDGDGACGCAGSYQGM